MKKLRFSSRPLKRDFLRPVKNVASTRHFPLGGRRRDSSPFSRCAKLAFLRLKALLVRDFKPSPRFRFPPFPFPRFNQMSKVIPLLERELKKPFLPGARRQLDWERSAIVDYDYVESDRQFAQKPGETERFSDSRDLFEEARKWSGVEPRFRFFLDGSRRTYRVADVPLGSKCLPILAGQVGVAVCERREKRMIAPSEYRTRYVLAVPRGLDKDGKTDAVHRAFFKSKLDAINKRLQASFQLEEILFYDDSGVDNFEDRAVAKINDYMIRLEKEAVQELVAHSRLKDDAWLIKDGSLEYAKIDKTDPFAYAKIRNNYKRVIGVSKSFNPELARLTKGKSASRMIADLKPFHRTPAFMYETSRVDGRFAVWYLRLRTQTTWSRGPFDGVVKLEKILVTDEERELGLPTDVVDKISAWVLNERNPVCYGKDARWANVLYPIHLTETFVKSRYLSSDHFLRLF